MIKVGDEVEILGLGEDKKSVVTGVEIYSAGKIRRTQLSEH